MTLFSTITPLGRLAYLIAVVTIALDQLTKAWVIYGLDLTRRGHIEISGIFDLTMVWNRGMSFGLGSGHGDLARWGFSIFAICIAAAVAWWARTTDKPLMAWTLGLLMGGAIGNVVDRIRYGAVVDFLDFSGLEYMNSGGIGLLVTLLVRAQRGGMRLLATGLSEHYRQILSLTRLDEAIEIHDDATSAAAAVGA